ncbi:MAG: M28 family peptidase [Muribaculaceae bacterium]|nr:M28 family peptidase [Muribaculaceae bacterium]
MHNVIATVFGALLLVSCSAKQQKNSDEIGISDSSTPAEENAAYRPVFSADSAYAFVKKQTDFGPRVPNTEAHRLAADWLSGELKRHGAEVTEQRADLTAFDGTVLHARNIFGQYNPASADRTLLLAHYDCRPWADEDPDPEKRKLPVDGANDGASGVAVLLEIARQISLSGTDKGIDILFVDAEDWGTEGNDESWAMGTRYFANNPVKPGYAPSRAILLDMVGGKDAQFPVEYFSQQNAPELVSRLWNSAKALGYGAMFPQVIGSAVTDDHIELIKAGIPAIDIIEYHPNEGFNPHWHTTTDNIDNIDKSTLGAVGETVMHYLID